MGKKEKQAKTGLTTKHWIGYMLGDMGGCMTFALMGAYVTRYYTNILGINTALLAVLLVIWNVWDAVNDPLMGTLMDKVFVKHQDKRGKFRPWILRASFPLALFAFVFWTVPTFFSGVALIVVVFICKILYEGFYTMFNIPMGSLLSAMSTTDAERASLSSARGVGSTIGNLIPMMIFPFILTAFGGTEVKTGYSVGALVMALLGLVTCLGHYFLTEERNTTVNASGDDAANDIKFSDILGLFKNNRPFLALCIHGVCFCTMQYINSTLGTYMYQDVLGSITYMSYQTAFSMVLMIPCLIFVPMLAKKYPVVPMVRICLMISAVLFGGLFLGHCLTTVPAIVHLIVSSLAFGFGSVSTYMQWGMVGEAIDYNDFAVGKRTEGTIYGVFNLTRRIGQTIGNSAAVIFLGWVGYNAALPVQSDATIFGIKFLCVCLPAILILGSWAAFRFVYNLDDETRAKMRDFKAAKVAAAEESANE